MTTQTGLVSFAKFARFVGGAGAIGAGAYVFQQHTSGNLHAKQQRADRAIDESRDKPATVEMLRERRPSDASVKFDKALVLGTIGGTAAATGAFMLMAGQMSTIPELVPGTALVAAISLGVLGGGAAGVIHNTLGNRFV